MALHSAHRSWSYVIVGNDSITTDNYCCCSVLAVIIEAANTAVIKVRSAVLGFQQLL